MMIIITKEVEILNENKQLISGVKQQVLGNVLKAIFPDRSILWKVYIFHPSLDTREEHCIIIYYFLQLYKSLQMLEKKDNSQNPRQENIWKLIIT